jgi:hypothetical protein
MAVAATASEANGRRVTRARLATSQQYPPKLNRVRPSRAKLPGMTRDAKTKLLDRKTIPEPSAGADGGGGGVAAADQALPRHRLTRSRRPDPAPPLPLKRPLTNSRRPPGLRRGTTAHPLPLCFPAKRCQSTAAPQRRRRRNRPPNRRVRRLPPSRPRWSMLLLPGMAAGCCPANLYRATVGAGPSQKSRPSRAAFLRTTKQSKRRRVLR